MKTVADELAEALRGLMVEFRGEFDSDGGRWTADAEPAMVAAREALERYEAYGTGPVMEGVKAQRLFDALPADERRAAIRDWMTNGLHE